MEPLTQADVELQSRPEHLEQESFEDRPIKLKPKQAEFIRSKAPFCAYGGGVGNGKTLAAIIKVWQHCEDNPGAYFLIGRKYFPELRDSTMRDFLQMMGKYGTFQAGDKKFIFPNGSEVIFRHLDNPDSLTNLNLSGYYVDQAEDIPEETFDYLNGRCRLEYNKRTKTKIKERLRVITFNPKGHDWIWRLFDQKKDADGFDLEYPDDYFLRMATTYENRDNLPDDYIRGIEARPKEWRDRFIHGSFDVKAGRIFEEYSRALHVVTDKHKFQIPESWLHFRSIDHGQNNPTSCHWYAVDPDNNVFVYREYYKPNAVVSHHVANIDRLSMEWEQGQLVHWGKDKYAYSVIDPSTHAKTRETADGWKFSIADEYMDAGIPTIGAQNDVLAGINRVREYLKGNERHFHPFLLVKDLEPGHPLYKLNFGRAADDPVIGAPKLYIFDDCVKLLEELPEYQWQPLKYNQIGLSNNMERPVKNFDHAVDDLRYAIMSRPVGPDIVESIDYRTWNDPIQLALLAKSMGLTKDDLIGRRMGEAPKIRHTEGGISTSDGLR